MNTLRLQLSLISRVYNLVILSFGPGHPLVQVSLKPRETSEGLSNVFPFSLVEL